MEGLTIYETPKLDSSALIATFAGWSDAAGAATGAVKYLTEHLGATKLADLDPEDYYDFTQVRPRTLLDERGERYVVWPGNGFFYWKSSGNARDLLFFIGIEPNLRWRAYTATILDLAQQHEVSQVIVVGALLDNVPHTRASRVSGAANRPELRDRLEQLGAPIIRYQGPTGIAGVLLDACSRRGLPFVSLWGHSPHYLQAMANPIVSLALLEKLLQWLPLPVDLGELREAAAVFQGELDKVIAYDPRLKQIIVQLEKAYDEGSMPPGAMPGPDELLRDLNEFLRRHRQGGQDR